MRAKRPEVRAITGAAAAHERDLPMGRQGQVSVPSRILLEGLPKCASVSFENSLIGSTEST
jgi:hypothetical protein